MDENCSKASLGKKRTGDESSVEQPRITRVRGCRWAQKNSLTKAKKYFWPLSKSVTVQSLWETYVLFGWKYFSLKGWGLFSAKRVAGKHYPEFSSKSRCWKRRSHVVVRVVLSSACEMNHFCQIDQTGIYQSEADVWVWLCVQMFRERSSVTSCASAKWWGSDVIGIARYPG